MKKTAQDKYTQKNISIAVIFIGMQGAGKTEYYNRYFRDAYVRIGLSELGTRHAERAVIRECISDGSSYVLDSQNLTREERRRYFSRAKEAGYRVIGYYFVTTVEDSLAHAGLGFDKTAEKRQKKAFDRIEPPEYNEGYDELYTVTMHRDGSFTTERIKRDANVDN